MFTSDAHLTVAAFTAVAAPAAFVVAAVVGARGEHASSPRLVERCGRFATWIGVVVAAGAFLATIIDGPYESPTIGGGGLGFGIRLDALSTIMLMMISLLAVVIFRYSITYLAGDARHGMFLSRLLATLGAVELLVISGNLVTLVGAWIATSLALHRLLVFYSDRPRAVVAARKKFLAARASDALLIGGALLLYREFDTGHLGKIFDGARDAAAGGRWTTSLSIAAACLAIAAVLKSAQFPTHGWLVEVMETPTPVSALLHAGILNAGPFLVLRFAYVFDASRVATTMLIGVGAFTALFASVALLTQPALKVGLGYSSAAHMGFTLMVCGMGIYSAALLHLVAHSFYKAHSFLSSGSVVDEARADHVAVPRRLGHPLRIAASAAVAAGIYLSLGVAFGIDFADDHMVLALGAIIVLGTTQMVAAALDSAGSIVGTGIVSLMALSVTASFFTLESGAHHLLSNSVPVGMARGVAEGILIGAVLAACIGAVVMQILEPSRGTNARRRAFAVHLRNGLYANALFDRAVGALRLPDNTSEVAR